MRPRLNDAKNGGTTVAVPITEPSAGKFEVIAQPGQEVRFEFTQLPSTLTRVGGSETIDLSLDGAVGQADDPGSATTVNMGGGPVDEVFPTDLLPEDTGLIVADAYDAEILRMAPETRLAPARRKVMVQKFARHAALRWQAARDPGAIL